MTVDYELIRQWDAWLRDPEHKQTNGTLRNDDGYCCLGGLCEVAGAEWRRGYWWNATKASEAEFVENDKASWYAGDFSQERLASDGVLPNDVANKVGIAKHPQLSVPEFLQEKVLGSPFYQTFEDPLTNGVPAARLNDAYHLSFIEIADCVRATWPEAFATTRES